MSKIAFVIYDLSNGGAERVVSLLSQEMAKKDDVYIILLHNTIGYEYGGKIINLNIPSSSGSMEKIINLLYRAIKLRIIFKKYNFDAIYPFMESSSIPALLASSKVVVSIRNNPRERGNKIYNFFIKNLYRKAQSVVVNSKNNKEILNRYFNLNNVEVIYNPVNFDDIYQKSQERIDTDLVEEEFIVAVGRLVKEKGFDFLIKAYHQAESSKSSKSLKIFILGEGKERKNLEYLIESLGLMDSVYLLGRVDNPYKYLSKAKFFVLSSRSEGFPNALIEALACKIPVISFDCESGPREIIKHKENGLLVEKENVDKLSEAIDLLYFDESLQEKFSNNAIASIEHLKIENIVSQWKSVGNRGIE